MEEHIDILIPIECLLAQLMLLCRGLSFDILVLSLDAIGDSPRMAGREI